MFDHSSYPIPTQPGLPPFCDGLLLLNTVLLLQTFGVDIPFLPSS